MSSPELPEPSQQKIVARGAGRLSLKIFVTGLAIAIVGASRDSPPVVAGVVGGLIVSVVVFTIIGCSFVAQVSNTRDSGAVSAWYRI
jgi:hypothetical protein